MASLFDLAVMTVSGAPGTGSTINLGGAATLNGVTFLTFAQAGATNSTLVDYSILDPVNGGCEAGVATYSSTGPSLTGRTPTVSSNSNAAINASASSIVRISPRAETLQNATLFTAGTLNIARLNGGTANQFAQGDGTFQTQSRKLLNTLTASGSSVLSDTTSLTSAFPEYEIELENILAATAGGQQLELQVQSGGSFQSSSYLATQVTVGNGSTSVSNPTGFIPMAQSGSVLTTGAGLSGTFRIVNPSGTAAPKNIYGIAMSFGGTVPNLNFAGGFWNANGAVTGLQILFGTGNIASGTMKIFGLT